MANPTVLILTRSMAGKELLSSVRKRIETFDIDCHTLTFNPEANEAIVFPHISGRIRHIDKGAGVLVLVDSDATHKKLLQRMAVELPVVCVTGLNDAMLESLTDCGGLNLQQTAEHVKNAAKSSIRIYDEGSK